MTPWQFRPNKTYNRHYISHLLIRNTIFEGHLIFYNSFHYPSSRIWVAICLDKYNSQSFWHLLHCFTIIQHLPSQCVSLSSQAMLDMVIDIFLDLLIRYSMSFFYAWNDSKLLNSSLLPYWTTELSQHTNIPDLTI